MWIQNPITNTVSEKKNPIIDLIVVATLLTKVDELSGEDLGGIDVKTSVELVED